MKTTLIILLGLVLTALMVLPASADQGVPGRVYDHQDRVAGHGRDARTMQPEPRRGGDHHRDGHSDHEGYARPDDRGRHHGGGEYYNRDFDRRFEYRHPEHHPEGYRRQPYHRFLGPAHFGHRHHDEYHYEGHWGSWDHWERYRQVHPDWYRHGRYYRDDGHLFFGFCDPAGGGCFYFSIGR